MARDLKAKIRLDADTRNADKGLAKVSSRLVDLGKNVLAPIAGFAALTKAFISVVAEVATTQKAVAQLTNSFKSLGDAGPAVTSALLDQASALSSVTEFVNADIIATQARISAFTKEEAQIKALTAATLDLAAGRSIGLVEASEAIAKSFGTAGNVLNEYGVSVEGAAGSTERLTAVTEGVASLWGGAAAAGADTLTQSVSNLAEALVRAAGASSQIVVENEGLVAGIQSLTQDINRQSRAIETETTFLGKLQQQLSGFTPIQSQLGVTLLQTTQSLEQQAQAIRIYGPLVETAAERTARMAKEFDTLNVPTRQLNEIFKELTAHLSEFNELSKVPGIPETEAALRALGVTLDDDVNKAIEKNNTLLLRADELYRLGRISRDDLRESEEQVAIANAKLNGTYEETNMAVGTATESTNVYSTALRETLAELEAVTAGELELADVTERTTQRRTVAREREQQTSFGTGQIFGRPVEGGTFTIPAGATVAANGRVVTPIFGSGPSGSAMTIPT